ncbi:unnamed protein product [Clonostachys rosea]|uniref:Peptidase S8/S53 domain-containing protein n=1 Tax=Bionectria ochroleuca TaxID=29856 RepID=A0ABY6U062_BIOOC|nr:unnamed protein product [Clonostachys rosea]
MRLSTLFTIFTAVVATPSKRSDLAPLLIPQGLQTSLIAGKYIVKFKETGDLASANSITSILSEPPEHVFQTVFKGFAGSIDQATLNTLRKHPDVEYIEQDAIVTLDALVTQPGAPWGLGRLSSVNGSSTAYTYDDSAGEGTCVYILDTGIDISHPEFGGRAEFLVNYAGGGDIDVHGHGTHVAGTVGSETFGVAKKTKLFGVKVLNNRGSGTYAGIIRGIDFVATDAQSRYCPKGAMANMSLGGARSEALNQASAALVNAGVFLAVAAGNSNLDAAGYSPASEPLACTIGATDSNDARAYYSNYGEIVDLFAPGSDVLSTLPGNRTGLNSGTSMASPHVAGLAAYLAALEGFPGADDLCTRIKNLATVGILTNIPSDTANRLAFNGNPSG